jgi:hypothetical protein
MLIKTVPAKTGVLWMREGLRIFFKAPLAFGALLFCYVFVTGALSVLPFIGMLAPLIVAPLGTVGFMHAGRALSQGRIPWPHVFVEPLRTGRVRLHVLLLGTVMAVLLISIFALTRFADGGVLFKLMMEGTPITEEIVKTPGFTDALAVLTAGSTVLMMLMWFAPALVCWHGYSVGKAIFGSIWAVGKNWRAFAMYLLAWSGAFFIALNLSALLLILFLGDTPLARAVLFPVAMTLLTAVLASFYPTYRDILEEPVVELVPEPIPAPPAAPEEPK